MFRRIWTTLTVKKVQVLTCLNEFELPVRVYYEDTDAGGVVYHANYLRFMERARTEWLRHLGFEQDTLAAQGIVFVVGSLDIAYRKPARFNEQLFVKTAINNVGKASITFKQTIWRQDNNGNRELLTSGEVKVVCVENRAWRPTPIPSDIRELI
jgi:acyl-CoA thioester hydrolase